MITFLLDAARIPDGTHVRKVTGQNRYLLKRELKIHMPDREKSQVITSEGVVYLTSDAHISGYPDTTKFAVDVDDDDAQEFLANLMESKS